MGLYDIGNIYGDFTIIERDKASRKVTVECNICNRKQTLGENSLKKRVNEHGVVCSKEVVRNENPHNKHTDWKFYRTHRNMRNRTTNPNNDHYQNYGGRGINSDEFKYFVDFYDSMYESYLEHVAIYGEDDTTLERINPDDNYCKENCTWKTWNEQAKNKRNIIKFHAIDPDGNEYYGENLKEFCEEHGIKYMLALGGIYQGNKTWKNGWFFEKCND